MRHHTSAQTGPASNLPRVVITLGLVSLCTDLSTQMIGPLLPLFLTNVLGAPVWLFGLIEGVGSGIAGILKVFSGWLSDHLGHRIRLMVAGYAISNLSKPLLALSTAWGQVFLIRALERTGKGFRAAPRDALLADVTSPGNRGRAFGFRRAMDELGAALGPLTATAILFFFHNSIRTVFALTLIPGLAAVMLLVTLREERSTSNTMQSRPKLSLANLPLSFRRFTVIAGFLALATFSQGFLVLRAQSLGLRTALIPLAYFLMNGVASALSVPTGRLADRIGKRPVLLVGFALLPLTYLGFAEARNPEWIWPLMALYGVFIALIEGNEKVYAAQLLNRQQRGTGLGTLSAITGILQLVASLSAGLLWQVSGAQVMFLTGSIVAALAFFVFASIPG